MTQKIDLKRTHRDLFSARRTPKIIDVPPLRYFLIDEEGAPEGDAFQEAIQALYSTAYTLKFALKKAGRTGFVVAPLEALWWSDDPRAFEESRRDEWRWTAMVMQPEHVEDADLHAALGELERKEYETPRTTGCAWTDWKRDAPPSFCTSAPTTRWGRRSPI